MDRSMDLAHSEERAVIGPATREEGLERLQAFVPVAGARYARERNYDQGTRQRDNVSQLSPWIRHRLVLEPEVVKAILARHSLEQANKFVQEVCWRTYWKGWLEMRPSIWSDYRTGVARLAEVLHAEPGLAARWENAVSGKTGIECFDAWSAELRETGYLHNHARMWFASIWIFTLELPWELGADFFLRYLLDGDPASNTLSWRWVAGLHTRGKTYLARPGNIERYTGGRFRPGAELSRIAKPVDAPASPRPRRLPAAMQMNLEAPFVVLVTEDDLHPESLALPEAHLRGMVGLACPQRRSPWQIGPHVADFARDALRDTMQRVGEAFDVEAKTLPAELEADELVALVSSFGARQLVTAYVPTGPVRELLEATRGALKRAGIGLVMLRRPWDDRLWPYARKGYFNFRSKALAALPELGMEC